MIIPRLDFPMANESFSTNGFIQNIILDKSKFKSQSISKFFISDQ